MQTQRILSPISSRSHHAAANGKKMHMLPAQVFAWIFFIRKPLH
jgi:hypothetical protein